VGGVAESTQMVSFLLYIGKLLWEAFILSIGLLAIFLTTIFMLGIFWDFVKDERKKSK
jgi:uncharacterized membrane protein